VIYLPLLLCLLGGFYKIDRYEVKAKKSKQERVQLGGADLGVAHWGYELSWTQAERVFFNTKQMQNEKGENNVE